MKPIHFVLAFGVVSMFADMVYEGARAITGPYLATFGTSAAMVGFITGLGEAVALVFRIGTGRLSDRTHRYWALSISGYAITVIAVPLIALSQTFWQAAGLIVTERFGKAVRTPARDTMLAQAGTNLGRGWTFAVHEALDQVGAIIGPLIVAFMIALSGYRAAFAILAVPGLLTLLTLAWLRRAVPRPSAYGQTRVEESAPTTVGLGALPRRFWLYAAFTASSMLGFATFAVLAYHQEVTRVIQPALIPITFALAMATDALAALVSGRLYDRIGLSGLIIALPLTALVPVLSFSLTPTLVWIGAAVWGAIMGIHESTMRAAVADLIPESIRGTGYGVFTAIYGLAWLTGSTVVGALYNQSVGAVSVFVIATQLLALAPFIILLRDVRKPNA
ncbi:MAG: MFS transporter [Alphaproteobacteria bacterium]|nr:MFS transporter [Alphaproteobacteria bacterium]